MRASGQRTKLASRSRPKVRLLYGVGRFQSGLSPIPISGREGTQMPKKLRVKPISSKYADLFTQFLTNLLASGYRIINPDGEDITAELIENVIEQELD